MNRMKQDDHNIKFSPNDNRLLTYVYIYIYIYTGLDPKGEPMAPGQ